MKLYYFKGVDGNIGDELNAWLWPRVFGPLLDDDDDHLLIGIGTILNDLIPESKKYTVLTSGFGYGNGKLPVYHKGQWEFLGLRGPLTKKKFDLDSDIPLLDGGYLMPKYLKGNENKAYKCAFIPHVTSIKVGAWESICTMVGIKLIDPRWPVEKFISELCMCERVITEAMHGAILADAYGIPWHPIKAYRHIDQFKWQDWALSLDMQLEVTNIDPTWGHDEDSGLSLKRRMINSIKRTVNKFGVYPKNWTPINPPKSSARTLKKAAKQIGVLVESNQFQLSDRVLLESRTNQLISNINNFISSQKIVQKKASD